MTNVADDLREGRFIVVIFDICSSTVIVEELLKIEKLKLWRDILIVIKKYLVAAKERNDFIIYKFLGDGWILLFPENFKLERLFKILKGLCELYEKRFQSAIETVIPINIPINGITFGLDKGTLINVVMNEQSEYIGRAINVASRLQNAIKDNDSSPQWKIMMSKTVHSELPDELKNKNNIKKAKRVLRNVTGGIEIEVKKMQLYKEEENLNKSQRLMKLTQHDENKK